MDFLRELGRGLGVSGGRGGVGDVWAVESDEALGYVPPQGPRRASNPVVFLEVEIEGRGIGRVELELRRDVAPRTAENFRALCASQGECSYVETPFHRSIPGFMVQGGDYTNGDGTGGASIYGARFPDETFELGHSGRGVLSMANAGPDTNGSQFFILTGPASWLDGKHVVFGQVVGGYGVIQAVEACGTRSGRCRLDARVKRCGVVAAATAALQPPPSAVPLTPAPRGRRRPPRRPGTRAPPPFAAPLPCTC